MSSTAMGVPLRVVPRLHALNRLCLAGSSYRPASSPPSLVFGVRPSQRRTYSSIHLAADAQRPVYKNTHEVIQRLVPPDLHSRTVMCSKLPKVATDDDVRELFEESGFYVQRLVMTFDGHVGHNIGKAWVVLASDDAAKAAVCHLNNAPLFDRRIAVHPPRLTNRNKGQVNLYWGWTASRDPQHEHANVRGPHLRPPKDIFRPIREGRRVVIDMPRDPKFHPRRIYNLLHNYNVDSISKIIEYRRSDSSARTAIAIDFTTRDEADRVVDVFNGYNLRGIVLSVHKWQVPLKYLGGASWDAGRGGQHYSGRDQGNAVGTNFASMQEEVLAKAILGKHDRKLWVPSHTY